MAEIPDYGFSPEILAVMGAVSRETGKPLDEIVTMVRDKLVQVGIECAASDSMFRVICLDNFDLIGFIKTGITEDIVCGEYGSLDEAKKEVERLTRESMRQAQTAAEIKEYRVCNDQGQYLEEGVWIND